MSDENIPTYHCMVCGTQINDGQKLLVEQLIKFRNPNDEHDIIWVDGKECEKKWREINAI